MSMGLLTGDDTPMVLRGPMVSKYLRMFIGSVAWPPLDLPPGSGDTQLTLAQSVPLSGAVIVTTPQEVSLKITRRGIRMFEKVHVPILGIVENMSTFVCPHCGETTDIFQHGGGERMSQQLGVPFLLPRLRLFVTLATRTVPRTVRTVLVYQFVRHRSSTGTIFRAWSAPQTHSREHDIAQSRTFRLYNSWITFDVSHPSPLPPLL